MPETENPSALKHLFNPSLLRRIADAIIVAHPKFDKKNFVAIWPRLQKLEMKPRVHVIRDELHALLPSDYEKALAILLKSLQKSTLGGFDLWPYMEFVQTYGLNDTEISLNALKKMTPLFTAEWAIRPFIKKYPTTTMAFLEKCAEESNEHVRRWASEGSRPRLPWGERLHDFIKDPSPTRAILEKLKFDEAVYVQKSIANHLNDIAKDHPAYVIKLLKNWKVEAKDKYAKHIDWIIRRSLRTLIKDGNPKALELIGVSHKADVQLSKLTLKKSKIRMGEYVEFEFILKSGSSKKQKIVIDYLIHFVKANKKTAPKVFKLKTFELNPNESLTIAKNHPIKKITTRDYYSGRHLLEIQVNGKVLAKIPWDLKAD